MYFKPLTESDIEILAEWLKRPHVTEWWDAAESTDEVRAKYLPLLSSDSGVAPYFAYLDGFPIGYIQSYVAAGSGDGWWPDEQDTGVRGIDLFLSDKERMGRGLGSQTIREFVQFLFKEPTVTKIQADPDPTNVRAIRCYEKAGFRKVGPITTPDGAAMLMVMERP